MNEKLLEKFRQKPKNKKGINIIAYESIPRWDKRKLLQKSGIGEGIMSAFLPLILNTLKSLLRQSVEDQACQIWLVCPSDMVVCRDRGSHNNTQE